tara:strand:+ start:357 stop:1097 length:741 start_codon:yes stop_codon:yes gene_type:complete
MADRAGFLLAEDQALKVKFSGIQLTDDRDSTRDVQVFFRYPEGETEKKYPFITLELMDINHAVNRQHSDTRIYSFRGTAPTGQAAGHYSTDGQANTFTYWPDHTDDVSTLASGTSWIASSPFLSAMEHVPVDLLYQVTTFTRSAIHDRYLQAHILTQVVPFRRGYLNVPIDDTSRHMDLLDWRAADMLDEEAGFKKRIFRKVYTLSVTSEIPATSLVGLYQVTAGDDGYAAGSSTFKDKITQDVLA